MSAPYNKKISVKDLNWLFHNVLMINYFIKRCSNTGINKTAFYRFKSNLICYIIAAIKDGIYLPEENVTYKVEGFETQENQPHKLICIIFTIGDNVYEFHQLFRDGIRDLLNKETSELQETILDYSKAPEGLFEDFDTSSLYQLWVDTIDKCEELNWNVYNYFDFWIWRSLMLKHYQGIKILPEQAMLLRKTAILRTGNRIDGHSTKLIDINDLRKKFVSIIQKEFNNVSLIY